MSTATTTATIVLPGDVVPEDQIPHHPKRKLALGPGLRFAPPSTVTATVCGALNSVRQKKNLVWVDSRGGRYVPSFDDPVIARVTGSANESFVCSLSAYTPTATLPHLSFENVTKKTKPNLPVGALVYARIVTPNTDLSQQSEAELTCVNPTTSRADGMGPLKGGMLFEVSAQMARRMLVSGRRARQDGQVVLLDRLGVKWHFDVAIGRNGYVWVDAAAGGVDDDAGIKRTIAIGNAIVRCDDMSLTIDEQEKLAAELLRKY